VLVGTVLEAAYFLFEVPTGVIADVYSRRRSIILGYLIVGGGFILEGSVPLFGMILLAEVIRAVGEACLSGATQAWLADEVGEDRIGALFVRGSQLRRLAGLLGIGASVGLGTIAIQLPIVVGGALSVLLAVFLLVVMPERGFRPLERTSADGGLFRTARAGFRQIRQQPLLLVFVAIAVAVGTSSEGFDRLSQAHVLLSFSLPSLGALEPVAWIGVLEAVTLLVGIAGAQLLTRLDLTDDRVLARYGLLAHGGWMLAVCVFGLTGDFFGALLAYWAARMMKSIGQPLLETWETRSIPSQVRATIISTLSQGDALGQTLGGPVIGAIGTWYSLRAAIVTTSLFHAPVLLLLTRARRLLNQPADTQTPGSEVAMVPPP
jgi:DHA3 family tetracycline resistance protein-like MFS transporter